MNESIPKILVELKKNLKSPKPNTYQEEKKSLLNILDQIQRLFTDTISNAYIEKVQNCLNQIENHSPKAKWTEFSQKLIDYLRDKTVESVKLISNIPKNVEPNLRKIVEILQNNDESNTSKLDHCSTIQKSVNFKKPSPDKLLLLNAAHTFITAQIDNISIEVQNTFQRYSLILDTVAEISKLTPKQKKVKSKLIGNLRTVTTSPDSVSASFDFDTLSLQLSEQHHHLSNPNKKWDLNKFHELNDQLHILSTVQNTFLLINKGHLSEDVNAKIWSLECQIHDFLIRYDTVHNSIFDTVNSVTRNHIDYPSPSPKIFKLKEILINKVFSRLSSNLKFMFGILEIKFPIQTPPIQKDNLPFSIFIISFSGGDKAMESIKNTLTKATLDNHELIDFNLDTIILAKKEAEYPFLKRVASIKISVKSARVQDHFAHVCAETPLFVEAEHILSHPQHENAQYQIKLGVFNYKLNDEYDRPSPHGFGDHQLPCLGCNLNQQTILNQFPKIHRQIDAFEPSTILTPVKREKKILATPIP